MICKNWSVNDLEPTYQKTINNHEDLHFLLESFSWQNFVDFLRSKIKSRICNEYLNKIKKNCSLTPTVHSKHQIYYTWNKNMLKKIILNKKKINLKNYTIWNKIDKFVLMLVLLDYNLHWNFYWKAFEINLNKFLMSDSEMKQN